MANEPNCWSCKAEFGKPEDVSTWDVRTEVRDGVEVIVERHVEVACPACGKTGSPDPEVSNSFTVDVDPPVPLAEERS